MNNPYKTMKADRKLFRKYALKNKREAETNRILTEHYPMLERCARQSAEECRKIQKQFEDPQILQGLFDSCNELCKDGILHDNNTVIDYFSGKINGLLLPYLPAVITCTLIHKCSEAVMHDDSELLEKSVRSLQKMRDVDFGDISEKLFSAEKILMSDPAGVYPYMNCETKSEYRKKVAALALKNKKSEEETATLIVEKAKKNNDHIGKYLFSERKSNKRSILYLVFEALIPLLVCIPSAILSGEWIISLLLYFPLWEILKYPIERTSLRNVAPKKFAGLELNSKAVSETHALITLSVIIPTVDEINYLKNRLENLYLSNAYGNVKVCCLADFKASDSLRKPEDKHILNALNKEIAELNKKYSGGFIAAVRPRSYSETQNEFIGKERKRGAIRELIRAVKGDRKGFLSITGDLKSLSETKYLFALDYDSEPVFDSLRELVAVAEHPLNKPVIKNGRVVSGYGILAPKTENSLSSASKSFFSSVMSQNSGVSSYDMHSTERYQSLFGESIFCGKGLINIDAYYELLDRNLPKEKILSHDIIEGEFLRTGFMPKAQIIEDFPETADGYYKRMHRWVRGDWQNSGFIYTKNPFGFVSRFKLFDNIRRSITPVICIAVLLYSSFFQGYAGIVGTVISLFALCASDIFSGINSVVHGGTDTVTRLFYSGRVPDGLGCFARAFFAVAYSARETFVCFDAIIRALWRVYISGDRLLEWTTSASSKENNSVYSCVPAVLTAAVLIIFGLPIHRMAGLLILSDIPLTLFGNSVVTQKKNEITSDRKEYLLSLASSMWEYFEDLCGKENNFLPPDNIQFAPHRAIAQRTSPTNIGLMFACFLSARDFGFITSEEMCRRMNRSLSSVEKLEKYKGNLLNWYNTSTFETLQPRFVSSVDSGNFLCCMTAVKEGIREYIKECPELDKTVKRLEKIIESTDLSVMFNENRKLFCIGINPDNNEKTESCYDLYMSEMRMTSYFAVARRLVPKSLWFVLDRPIVRNGRYSGLASWTGTMFEYFMADIFVPAPYGSLSNEALRFCLQSQRKKAGRNPFGMSESGFYAFDGDLNYQYKAHGVQKLAFKRDSDKDNVISPYSSFLTLNLAPRISLKNLKMLEKLGMKGKYGFYEAVDLSSEKKHGSRSLVNSFMVHHVGMSLLSVDNFLNKNCMQKRFMNDRFMRGARTLLEEKPISGKEVFKDVVPDNTIPTIRERTHRINSGWLRNDDDKKRYSVFSNGRMTVFVSNNGEITVMIDGEKVLSDKFNGVFESGNRKFCFINDNSEIKITDNAVEFKTSYDNFCLYSRVCASQNYNCVFIKLTIKNKLDNVVTGKIKVEKLKNNRGLFVSCGFINAETKFCENSYETDLEILSKRNKELVFVYATETSESDAGNLFESMRTEKRIIKTAENPFNTDEFIRVLSERYLPVLMNYKNENDNDLMCKYGIREDYPVITVRIANDYNIESVRNYVIFNRILRNCGIKNTLIIYIDVPNEEKTSALQTIESILNEERCDLMIGIGGGIYVFHEEKLKKSDYASIAMKSQVYESV